MIRIEFCQNLSDRLVGESCQERWWDFQVSNIRHQHTRMRLPPIDTQKSLTRTDFAKDKQQYWKRKTWVSSLTRILGTNWYDHKPIPIGKLKTFEDSRIPKRRLHQGINIHTQLSDSHLLASRQLCSHEVSTMGCTNKYWCIPLLKLHWSNINIGCLSQASSAAPLPVPSQLAQASCTHATHTSSLRVRVGGC